MHCFSPVSLLLYFDRQVAPPKTSRPDPVPVESGIILLVEDNQDNIESMKDYLESRGYQMFVTNNGQQAIDWLQSQHPDIILMDIQMPEMDGLEATRRIREMPEYTDIPIVALTALSMPGDREKCLSAGISHYLAKPVKLRELAATIQTLLTNS